VAFFKPGKAFLDRPHVDLGGVFGSERIDEDEVAPHLRDGFQQVVSHGLDVRPHAPKKGQEDDAFDPAEGVV
jgi:hypothetical protein